jgi:8-oxo-dGTP pyrophosphatase MutT (NUDIX family)
MSKPKHKSSKQAVARAAKGQVGAIPIRLNRKGKPMVLLVTSRGTRRWVIPKGWPIEKLSPADTAMQEAFEEAGIKGRILRSKPIGRYRYRKGDQAELGKITVRVFLMRVKRQVAKWPERRERKLRWVRPRRAASMVAERKLAILLARIPKIAGRRAA